MARPVKPRTNYFGEAQVIARIMRAVEADEVHTPEWRERVLSAGRTLLTALLHEEDPRDADRQS